MSSTRVRVVGPKRVIPLSPPAAISPSSVAAAAANNASAALSAAASTASVAKAAAAPVVMTTVVETATSPAMVAATSSAVAAAAAAATATVAAASANTTAGTAAGVSLHEWIRKEMFANEKVVAALTAAYFGYVVLGGINHNLHHHIYTGDENESVFTRLRKMKPVVFREEVYDEFFSFKHYFTTYRIHVLMAGVWLLTGAYNLRNTPSYAGRDSNGKALFDGWLHARASGYVYVISSLLKGITATVISLRSHSLGWARYPMALYGVWDVISLYVAFDHIRNGRIAEHKEWMIRNFSVGAGSIWVRVFGAIWAMFDLNFMKSNDMYRKMNNVILFTGFTQGVLFGEYWLAKDDATRRKFEIAQLANVALTIAGAINVYSELRQEAREAAAINGENAEKVNRKLDFS